MPTPERNTGPVEEKLSPVQAFLKKLSAGEGVPLAPFPKMTMSAWLEIKEELRKPGLRIKDEIPFSVIPDTTTRVSKVVTPKQTEGIPALSKKTNALTDNVIKGNFKKTPDVAKQLDLRKTLDSKLKETKDLITKCEKFELHWKEDEKLFAADDFHRDTSENTQFLRNDEAIIAKTVEVQTHINTLEAILEKV